MADPITRAAESMWVVVPLRLQRRYSSLRGIVGDWYGIALVPSVAVLAMITVAVTFGVVGALDLGFDVLYSESLLIMAALIALGAFSGQLGITGLISFALGDFFLQGRAWTVPSRDYSIIEQFLRARLPLIITYLLLAVAVLVIPRLGKNIALGVGQWRRIPTDLAWLVSTPIAVLVSWLGLRTWAALAPTLLRPYFVWSGLNAPTVESIEVLQTQTSGLVAAGVGATVARQFVVAIGIYVPAVGARLAALEARAHYRLAGDSAALATPAPPSRAVRLRADVLSALVASLILSGILETRLLWAGYFAAFFVVRMLRSGTVQFDALDRWKAVTARVPVVARLGVMWFGAVLYRSLLTNEAIGSYRAMAFVVLAGVITSFLIFPGQPEPAADGPEWEPDPNWAPPRTPRSTGAVT